MLIRGRAWEIPAIHAGLLGACGFRRLVTIFSQKGNKAVISFSYACVRTEPAGMGKTNSAGSDHRCCQKQLFSSIDINNKSMQIPFFRLIL
jgi:hypothetical protein